MTHFDRERIPGNFELNLIFTITIKTLERALLVMVIMGTFDKHLTNEKIGKKIK